MTNTHNQTEQMVFCRQNLTLGALNSHRTLSVLVGVLFKKFSLFLNMPRIQGVPGGMDKTSGECSLG